MITLLEFLQDLMLAVLAPRAALVAENLLLRPQVVLLRRQVKRPRLRPSRDVGLRLLHDRDGQVPKVAPPFREAEFDAGRRAIRAITRGRTAARRRPRAARAA